MNPEYREATISFIGMASCDDVALWEHLKEPMTWILEGFSDDDLRLTALLASHLVPRHEEMSKKRLLRSLINNGDFLGIRTLVNHLDEIQEMQMSMHDACYLLDSLRRLKLMSDDDDYYPFLKSQEPLLRKNIYGNQNDELMKLVHDYPQKSDEIITLFYTKGIKDAGLVRVHVENKAPALTDGIL